MSWRVLGIQQISEALTGSRRPFAVVARERMELERLRSLALTWSGLLAALAALVLALFLRRLLPESRRRRGRSTVVVLLIAPLVHFLAHGLGAVGFPTASAVLDVIDV